MFTQNRFGIKFVFHEKEYKPKPLVDRRGKSAFTNTKEKTEADDLILISLRELGKLLLDFFFAIEQSQTAAA